MSVVVVVCLFVVVFLCSSSSGRIIGARDHASVQISVAEVNETGTVTGASKSYAICGFIRSLVGFHITRTHTDTHRHTHAHTHTYARTHTDYFAASLKQLFAASVFVQLFDWI